VAGSALDATIGVDYDNIFSPDRRWVNDSGTHDTLSSEGYFSVPNLGAYSQVEWHASPTADVTVGLRYDRVTYRFENYRPPDSSQQKTFDHVSPRLAVAWGFEPPTSLY